MWGKDYDDEAIAVALDVKRTSVRSMSMLFFHKMGKDVSFSNFKKIPRLN